MKRTSKVIARSCFPMHCPLLATLTLWLTLDRLDAAGWIWGAVGLVVVVAWFAWIVALFNEQPVDVIERQ